MNFSFFCYQEIFFNKILILVLLTWLIIFSLDRCVSTSLQRHHEQLCGAARVVKTDHTLRISEFPALLKESLLRSATPLNITAGFRSTGIWPLDRTLIAEDKLAPATAHVSSQVVREGKADNDGGSHS